MQTKATTGENPHWRFVFAADLTWRWRLADIISYPMPSLEAAIADAIVMAEFDPVNEYWNAAVNERTDSIVLARRRSTKPR